jgi:glycosyltransferase involved in cell wall biosynthesis
MGEKNMKIYLQYPWKFPDSPYYKYLLDSPPEEVIYLNTHREKGVITHGLKFWFLTRLKVKIRHIAGKIKLPFPNAHLTKYSGKYDLIHCAHCLSKNKNKPWVADLEHAWSMWIAGHKTTKLAKKMVKKILFKKNCKKIMPWTEYSKNQILRIFPKLKSKIEVVYPAITSPKKNFYKKEKLILFSGRDFRLKGGFLALEIMRKVKKENPSTRCIFISRTPKKIKEEFKEIEIYDLMPQKKLFEFMGKSSIFLYPSLMDTFGFSILEAFKFGTIPFVLKTINTPSVEEIIENKNTGLVFPTSLNIENKNSKEEKRIIEEITQKVNYLLKNKKLREKMSKKCINIIKEGKFSIKERNKKLKRIYEEALK